MKILKDVISYVASRSGMVVREDILREINNAWEEIWNTDDLPNSVFEVTLKSEDAHAHLALPGYIGKVRAVKTNSKQRIELNTPRPYYHDDEYEQSPWTWRIIGNHPLEKAITNASKLSFVLPFPCTSQFKITVIGATDTAAEGREVITFPVNEKTVWSSLQYSDVSSVTKNILLDHDVTIKDANGNVLGNIPNLSYVASHVIVQIVDKCNVCCTNCRCFDVLYKKATPVLHYDEQIIDYPGVLMTKTLEWIALPKDGQEQKAILFGAKSKQLLAGLNQDDKGVSHVLDVSADRIYSDTGSWGHKL